MNKQLTVEHNDGNIGYFLTGIEGGTMNEAANQIVSLFFADVEARNTLVTVWADYQKQDKAIFESVISAFYYNAMYMSGTDKERKALTARIRTRLAETCKRNGISRRKFTKVNDKDGDHAGYKVEIAATRQSEGAKAKKQVLRQSDKFTANRVGKLSRKATRIRLYANMIVMSKLGTGDMDDLKAAVEALITKGAKAA